MRPSPFVFLVAWLSACLFCMGAGTWNGVSITAWNGIAITAWNGTGISVGGTSYLINEDFEGDTSSWTVSASGGTVNLGYTTGPLNGTKSAYLTRSSGAVLAYKSLGSTYAILAGKAKAKVSVFPASNLTARKFLSITNSSGTYLGSLAITTVDSGATFSITAVAISTSGTTSSAKFTKGDLVYLWMDFDAGTDVFTVMWNSSDSKPTGDSTKQSTISGTAFANGARIEMSSDVAASEYLFDDVQVWVP